jgi:hypothetical protein
MWLVLMKVQANSTCSGPEHQRAVGGPPHHTRGGSSYTHYTERSVNSRIRNACLIAIIAKSSIFYSVEKQAMFRRKISPQFSGLKNKTRNENDAVNKESYFQQSTQRCMAEQCSRTNSKENNSESNPDLLFCTQILHWVRSHSCEEFSNFAALQMTFRRLQP